MWWFEGGGSGGGGGWGGGFFFNDTATTEIYTLSLHDALPIFISVIDTVVENGGRSQPSYLAWSTYPQFNVIHQANIRIPTVKV